MAASSAARLMMMLLALLAEWQWLLLCGAPPVVVIFDDIFFLRSATANTSVPVPTGTLVHVVACVHSSSSTGTIPASGGINRSPAKTEDLANLSDFLIDF